MAGCRPLHADHLALDHPGRLRAGAKTALESGGVGPGLATGYWVYRVTAVLHFAALSLVGASAKQPIDYYDVNTLKKLRTLTLETDMTSFTLVPPKR